MARRTSSRRRSVNSNGGSAPKVARRHFAKQGKKGNAAPRGTYRVSGAFAQQAIGGNTTGNFDY